MGEDESWDERMWCERLLSVTRLVRVRTRCYVIQLPSYWQSWPALKSAQVGYALRPLDREGHAHGELRQDAGTGVVQ